MVAYCQKCGRQVPIDANICPYCAQNISQNKITISQTYEQPKQKNNNILIAIIIIVILLISIPAIAATVFVYFSGMLDGGSTITPDIVFIKEITPNSGLRILGVDAEILWDDLSITGGIAPETGTGTYIDVGEFVKLKSGQTIITISYKPTNTLIGSWTWGLS